MTCLETREALSAWSDGELAALPEDARAHLEGCPDCRRVREDFARLERTLQPLYQEGCPPSGAYRWPADEKQRSAAERHRFSRLFVGLAAAALLAVALWALQPPVTPARPPAHALVAQPERAGTFEVAGGVGTAKPGTDYRVTGRRGIEVHQGSVFLRLPAAEAPFQVRTPHGTVNGRQATFSVTVTAASVRVAVGEGSLELAGEGGVLALASRQAGDLLAAQRGAAAAPELRPDLTLAAETLWRPWASLDAAERAERLTCLRILLGDANAANRAEALPALVEAGVEALAASEEWARGAGPALRAGLVAFWCACPPGQIQARTQLRAVIGDAAATEALRIDALRGFARVGSAEDLPFLADLEKSARPASPNLAKLAAEVQARLRERLKTGP